MNRSAELKLELTNFLGGEQTVSIPLEYQQNNNRIQGSVQSRTAGTKAQSGEILYPPKNCEDRIGNFAINNEKNLSAEEHEKKIKNALQITTSHLAAQSRNNADGSTLAMAVPTKEGINVAYVGDSYLYFVYKNTAGGYSAKKLTEEHEPTNPAEVNEVRKAHISKDHNRGTRLGSLQVTRSIGDKEHYQYGKGDNAEIRHHQIPDDAQTPLEAYVITASDGLRYLNLKFTESPTIDNVREFRKKSYQEQESSREKAVAAIFTKNQTDAGVNLDAALNELHTTAARHFAFESEGRYMDDISINITPVPTANTNQLPVTYEFDGHGGDKTSQYLEDNIEETMTNAYQMDHTNFDEIDKRFTNVFDKITNHNDRDMLTHKITLFKSSCISRLYEATLSKDQTLITATVNAINTMLEFVASDEYLNKDIQRYQRFDLDSYLTAHVSQNLLNTMPGNIDKELAENMFLRLNYASQLDDDGITANALAGNIALKFEAIKSAHSLGETNNLANILNVLDEQLNLNIKRAITNILKPTKDIPYLHNNLSAQVNELINQLEINNDSSLIANMTNDKIKNNFQLIKDFATLATNIKNNNSIVGKNTLIETFNKTHNNILARVTPKKVWLHEAFNSLKETSNKPYLKETISQTQDAFLKKLAMLETTSPSELTRFEEFYQGFYVNMETLITTLNSDEQHIDKIAAVEKFQKDNNIVLPKKLLLNLHFEEISQQLAGETPDFRTAAFRLHDFANYLQREFYDKGKTVEETKALVRQAVSVIPQQNSNLFAYLVNTATDSMIQNNSNPVYKEPLGKVCKAMNSACDIYIKVAGEINEEINFEVLNKQDEEYTLEEIPESPADKPLNQIKNVIWQRTPSQAPKQVAKGLGYSAAIVGSGLVVTTLLILAAPVSIPAAIITGLAVSASVAAPGIYGGLRNAASWLGNKLFPSQKNIQKISEEEKLKMEMISDDVFVESEQDIEQKDRIIKALQTIIDYHGDNKDTLTEHLTLIINKFGNALLNNYVSSAFFKNFIQRATADGLYSEFTRIPNSNLPALENRLINAAAGDLNDNFNQLKLEAQPKVTTPNNSAPSTSPRIDEITSIVIPEIPEEIAPTKEQQTIKIEKSIKKLFNHYNDDTANLSKHLNLFIQSLDNNIVSADKKLAITKALSSKLKGFVRSKDNHQQNIYEILSTQLGDTLFNQDFVTALQEQANNPQESYDSLKEKFPNIELLKKIEFKKEENPVMLEYQVSKFKNAVNKLVNAYRDNNLNLDHKNLYTHVIYIVNQLALSNHISVESKDMLIKNINKEIESNNHKALANDSIISIFENDIGYVELYKNVDFINEFVKHANLPELNLGNLKLTDEQERQKKVSENLDAIIEFFSDDKNILHSDAKAILHNYLAATLKQSEFLDDKFNTEFSGELENIIKLNKTISGDTLYSTTIAVYFNFDKPKTEKDSTAATLAELTEPTSKELAFDADVKELRTINIDTEISDSEEEEKSEKRVPAATTDVNFVRQMHNATTATTWRNATPTNLNQTEQPDQPTFIGGTKAG